MRCQRKNKPSDADCQQKNYARNKYIYGLLRGSGNVFSDFGRPNAGLEQARAVLAADLNPKPIICDEAVSALDVSIRGQVINLPQDLRKEFGLT